MSHRIAIYLKNFVQVKFYLTRNGKPLKTTFWKTSNPKTFKRHYKEFRENEESSYRLHRYTNCPEKRKSPWFCLHERQSEIRQKNLLSQFKQAYSQVWLKVIFRITFQIYNLFPFKDKIPLKFKSNVVYGVHCTNCSLFYVWKTKKHIVKSFKEHRDILKPSAVSEYLLTIY